RERVETLCAGRRTEQEVLELKPLAGLDAKWAANNPALAISHTRNVYNSFRRLKGKQRVPAEGFEPPPTRLRSGCSTTELRRRTWCWSVIFIRKPVATF